MLPTWERPLLTSLLVPSVVLPPEKSEGHEGQGQLFSMDDGEKAASHEGPLRVNKKHLNIDVSPLLYTVTYMTGSLGPRMNGDGPKWGPWPFQPCGLPRLPETLKQD